MGMMESKLRLIESSLLRPVQQTAFLCAAQCNTDSVQEVREACVESCFRRYQLVETFNEKQRLVERAVNKCATECLPDNKIVDIFHNVLEEKEKRRREFLSCLGPRTQAFAPLIKQVLDDLSNSLK